MAKKKRSFRLYLKDIIESIEKIQANALKGKEAFLEDENMQDSIIRKLEIIGEASNINIRNRGNIFDFIYHFSATMAKIAGGINCISNSAVVAFVPVTRSNKPGKPGRGNK